jgi:hypothetical protein
MIAKTVVTESFHGTTKYVIGRSESRIIGGNMYGDDVSSLVTEFNSSQALNPQIKAPCYHLMLSLPSADRELTDERWAEIGDRHLATMIAYSKIQTEISDGHLLKADVSEDLVSQRIEQSLAEDLPAHSYFIVKHEDKDHQHIHLVASRINLLSTRPIRTWYDYHHSQLSARRLEEKYDLTRVPCSWESKNKAMTSNQVAKLDLGLPGEEIIRRAIDEVVRQQPITIPELQAQLWTKHQVRAEVSYYSHGGVRGIKYGIDVGETNPDGSSRLLWKQGNNLNKYKYSFNKLQTELGLNYEPERDDPLIKIYNHPSQIPPAKEEAIAGKSAPMQPQPSPISPPAAPTNKQVPSSENWQEIYRQYQQGLERLLPTDRDREIAKLAFERGYERVDVCQLIAVSPVGWTEGEVELIVDLGRTQLLEQQEREREQLAAQLEQKRQPERENSIAPRKTERGLSL